MQSSRQYRSIRLNDFPAEPVDVEQQSVESSQLDALATHVRFIYHLLCRDVTGNVDFGKEPNPRWDGGRDKHGRNHKPVWPKIAKHLITIGADPLSYIKSQFKGVSKTHLPLPNTFISAAAVGRYNQYTVGAVIRLRRELDYETQSISARAAVVREGLKWPAMKAMRKALLTHSCVYASSLLRYCFAVEYEMADVAALYHDAALIQYVFQKQLYDVAWEGCIPEHLQTEGQSLLDRLTV